MINYNVIRHNAATYVFSHDGVGNERSDEAGEVGQAVGDAHESAGKVGRHVDMSAKKAAVNEAVKCHCRHEESDAGRLAGERH